MSTRRLIAAVLLFAPCAHAAVPASGTIGLDTRELVYEAGPFLYRNPTAGAIFVDAVCNGPALPCDDFELTVDLPPDYVAAHPDDVITFEWRWPNPVEDYDYTILDEEGNVITAAGTASDPEHATIGARPGKYILRGLPFLVAGGSFTGTIRLASPVEAPVLPLPAGVAPEFTTLIPPDGLGNGAAEPSIGFNPATQRFMYLAGTETLRGTLPENLAPPLPEACDAQWEDVSALFTGVITADPILFTDQGTGRTFVSQMHIPIPVPPTAVGLNSIFGYTDDDGETWVPGQIGPPEGGYDHQTVGSGPYPESLRGLLSNPLNKGSAVYYCSQAGITAFCARSDTGGLTFPTGVPIYDAFQDGFGGIHGHVKVAPDGTVYVPVKACGDEQCVTVSEDAGQTWEVRRVPGAAPGASDPAVGIATDGTVYFCYANGADGRAHVAVSKDKGLSWERDYDVGAAQKILSTVFPQAVAGDPDRAACAFLGSTRGGNFQALDFPGEWHGFVATTYDGGATWATVDVTPDRPVQRATGIWLSGGGATQRNLLDFNDITLDHRGRTLFAYADGCTGDCELGGDTTFDDKANVARQIGGRPLYAAFDPPPSPPGAPCLAGTRSEEAAHLTWRIPASGGAAISGYKVYRSAGTSGAEILVATLGAKARYDDFAAPAGVDLYRYRVTALNARGESVYSNVVELPGGSGSVPPAAPTEVDDSRFGGGLGLAWLLATLAAALGPSIRRCAATRGERTILRH